MNSRSSIDQVDDHNRYIFTAAIVNHMASSERKKANVAPEVSISIVVVR